MNITWYASVFFLLSYGILLTGLYRVKKSEQMLTGGIWLGLLVIASLCLHTFWAAVIGLFHIPINLYSMGLLDLALGCGLLAYTKRSGERQAYRFERYDLYVIGGLLIMAIIFGVKYYKLPLSIHYLTVDPAAHFKSAMDMVNSQSVNSMFYSALNNGLLIELLGPLFPKSEYYQIFLLAEPIHFFLSGLMFFGAVRRFCHSTFSKAAAGIGMVIYLLGYPLNNHLYGFVYLGMGVTLIAYLITVMDLYRKGEVFKKILLPMMMLGCLGLFECYVLFMPVTFFGLLLCIALEKQKQKRLFSWEMVRECLAIFLIPCILGLLYTWLGIFGGGDTSVGSAISTEGAIYRDLYSNFIPMLPLVLFGYVRNVKHREWGANMVLLPFFLVFVAVLGFFGMQGKVSSYYYYKNYYVLWLLFFLLMIQALAGLSGQARFLAVSWLAMFGGLGLMWTGNLEARIAAHNPLYVSTGKAGTYLDIYTFNYTMLHSAPYSAEKMELYQYVCLNLLDAGETQVPLAGYWEDDYWYQGITDQRLPAAYAYWNGGEEAYFEELWTKAEYVLVLYDGEIYQNHQEYFDSLPRVMENGAGFVAKVAEGM